MNKTELCNAIKVCLKKSDDHWRTAGQYLIQLYDACDNQKEFLRLTKDKIGIGKSRTYEILAIADGTKTIEEMRAATTARTRKHKSVRSGTDNTEDEDREEAFPPRVMVDTGNGRMRPATPEEEAAIFAVASAIFNPIAHAWERADREQRATFVRLFWNDVVRIHDGADDGQEKVEAA